MKIRATSLLALAAALAAAPGLQGCYGNFSLTRKVYQWNGSLGNKWISSIVMIAFTIIPVYGAAATVDAIVLNLIEFWTGSNPMAMAPGDKEIRVVTVEGKSFQLTATRNRMEVVPLDNPENAVDLVYDPGLRSWFAESAEGRRLVARESADLLTLYHADGRTETVTR